MSVKRLLFFVTEDWYFYSHRLELAKAAKLAGYDVIVVTRLRRHGDLIRAAGLRVVPFENERSSLNPLTELWTLLRLILLYRRERPDVVHHVAMKPVLYGSVAARLTGTPHVVNAFAGMGWLFTSRGGMARRLRRIVLWLLRRLLRSGITLVQNPDDARLMAQLGVPESRIMLIPGSGVDLDEFSVHPEPTGIPIVLFPARLLWDKGVGDFVAAARLLRQRNVAARFVLAGDPDPLNPATVPPAQVAAWVREGIVDHLGWVDDMPSVLAECHIVCMPSYYREGIPKSLIEAAAAGRPIVTTDLPGCREIVHDGLNGLLVPPHDAGMLAEALERLISDADLRRQMGARGRLRAEKEFGLERVIRKTLAVYAGVVG